MARTDKTKGREETLRRKEIRKLKLKSVKVAAAVLVGATALSLGFTTDAAPAEAHNVSCTGSVIAYEDGTWAGGQVTVNGRLHADAWIVVPPSLQNQVYVASSGVRVYQTNFPLSVNGQDCKTYIGRP